MAAGWDFLLDHGDRATFGRRQLMKGLAFAAGGALVGKAGEAWAAEGGAIAPAMTINHINLGVADVTRTMDYYSAVLGARVQANPVPTTATMYFPGARPF